MKKHSLTAGLIAADILLVFFIVFVVSISGWEAARTQLTHYWYYIVALAVGFGVQVGLYVYLRDAIRQSASRKTIAATGTTSTLAMISCCTHYLVNLLPILGVSGIAAFVGQYQTQLFWAGLLMNGLGIALISRRVLQFRHSQAGQVVLESDEGIPQRPLINTVAVLVAFALVVGGTWVATTPRSSLVSAQVQSSPSGAKETTPASLETKTNEEGGMTVAVTPKQVADGSWEFLVAIDNHVQDVMQDMVAVSVLTDQNGVAIRPSAWVGDPPGGHHRQGTLRFATVSAGAKNFTLTLRELGGVSERFFTWENLIKNT